MDNGCHQPRLPRKCHQGQNRSRQSRTVHFLHSNGLNRKRLLIYTLEPILEEGTASRIQIFLNKSTRTIKYISNPTCQPCSLLFCYGSLLLQEEKLMDIKIYYPKKFLTFYPPLAVFPILSSYIFHSPCSHPPLIQYFPPTTSSLTPIYVSSSLNFTTFLLPTFPYLLSIQHFPQSRLSSVHFHSFFEFIRYSLPLV